MIQTFQWNNLLKGPLYKQIIAEWQILLADTGLDERAYQAFLQKHPAIFLAPAACYLVISKLKLGSDHETDFVVVEEGYSDGTRYELIEIESPHTRLFDSKGKPTAKFNAALQQVRDWKRYLINNKPEFRKILPTVSTKVVRDSKIRFKIIIGRRTENAEDLEKRRQIEDLEDVEIISFDRVTDMAKARQYFNDTPLISAREFDDISYAMQNEMACPFYECTGDSAWRAMCRRGSSHIYTWLVNDILNARKYNEYYESFVAMEETGNE